MKQLLAGFIYSLTLSLLLAGNIHAQTPAPGPLNPGGYEPLQSCGPNLNNPADVSVPPPFCSPELGSSVNTVPFVAPEGRGNWVYDPAAPDCAIMGSAIGDSGTWVNAVCNRTYRDGQYIIQKSNDKHLTYLVSGGSIIFLEDTTWANGEMCSGNGPAMQRMTGIKVVDTNLSCITGDTSESSGVTRSNGSNAAYQYVPPGHEQNILSSANSCQNAHAGNISQGNKLIYYGPGRCGSWSGNVIALEALPGTAGAGEVMFYCENIGLCAWYQRIDWDPTNFPSTWTAATDVCAGFGFTPQACYVDQYVVNEPMKLSLVEQLGLAIQNSLPGQLLNLQFNIGVLDPQDDYNTDNLTPQANWLRDVFIVTSHADVKPRIDEDKIKHKSSLQSVICYNDPSTGEAQRLESQTPIIVGGHPWVSRLEDGVEGLSTYTARHEKPLTNSRYAFNDDFDEILGAHPECPERDIGAQPPQMVLPAVGVNTYAGSGGPGTSPIIQIGLRLTEAILQAILSLGGFTYIYEADLIPAQHMSNSQKVHTYTTEFGDSRLAQEFTELTAVPHGQQTNRFIKPDGSEDVKGTRNEFTYQDRFKAICTECATIPHEIQVRRGITGPDYCGACKADVSAGNQLGNVDYPAGTNTNTPSTLGYTIPFTNDQCSITQAAVDAGIAYYSGAPYGAETRENMTRVQNGIPQWEMINRNASSLGINPLFALTLWLEETAAGAIGSAGMGCAPRINPSGGSWSATETQVRCLGTVVNADSVQNASNQFLSFMCRYSGETGWQTGSCGLFENNPNFVPNVRKFYELLSNATLGLPAACRLTTP